MQKGDTPLKFKWLKNGIHVDDSSQMVSVTQVTQFNSILAIEQLLDSHSGNYSCVVSNQAGEVETSQALLVNGKSPKETEKKVSLISLYFLSNFIVFLRVLQGEHLSLIRDSIHTMRMNIVPRCFLILFVERDSSTTSLSLR